MNKNETNGSLDDDGFGGVMALVGGKAVVVSGGDEGRFHRGERELAFHGVHDLVRRFRGAGAGGGSARGRHAPGGDRRRRGSEGWGREFGGIGRGNGGDLIVWRVGK